MEETLFRNSIGNGIKSWLEGDELEEGGDNDSFLFEKMI
jgi:hypothetical protein